MGFWTIEEIKFHFFMSPRSCIIFSALYHPRFQKWTIAFLCMHLYVSRPETHLAHNSFQNKSSQITQRYFFTLVMQIFQKVLKQLVEGNAILMTFDVVIDISCLILEYMFANSCLLLRYLIVPSLIYILKQCQPTPYTQLNITAT